MARANPLRIRDYPTAVLVGLAMIAAGGWILYDAHEGRGRNRPFWLRVAGGGWV